MEDRSFFRMVVRMKAKIISGGENAHRIGVEHAPDSHLGEVVYAVIGLPDDDR